MQSPPLEGKNVPEHERARAPKHDRRRPAERGGKPGARNQRGDRKPPAGRSRSARQPRAERANRPAPTLTGPSGFTPLAVPDVFAAVLQQQGINDPYPIQQATIPEAIAGRDILGRGRTGSGKTLAFGLPLVTRLSKGGPLPARRSPRGLVLVPTRELATQVMDVLRPLTDAVGLDVCLVIGGASYDKQISRLSKGTDIVVATPGRLFDLTERGAADLSHIRTVVIDEADQMADMGFLPQVEVLLDQVPSHGQRLLFSATLDDGVDALVKRYLRDPREHATDPDTATVTTMEHKVVVIPHAQKQEHAAGIARGSRRTIIFVRTRADAEVIAEQFGGLALATDMLHGGMSQRARSRALDGFRAGRTSVLVATDVAARGIHVDDIAVVLQLDPPRDHKDYLHRAGRTARAGAAGTVITLAAPHQQRGLQRLLERAGVTAEVDYQAPRTRTGARGHGQGRPQRAASRYERRAG
jgi:superfamily II DNA/RNA helicase